MAQIPLLNGAISDQPISVATTEATNDRAFGSGVPALPPAKVRVAYVVPSNRTPQPNYKENLQFAMEMAQMWYFNNEAV